MLKLYVTEEKQLQSKMFFRRGLQLPCRILKRPLFITPNFHIPVFFWWSKSNTHLHGTQQGRCLMLSRSSSKKQENDFEVDEFDEVLSVSREYEGAFQENYLHPDGGHNVFVVQPDVKSRRKKGIDATLNLDEACLLVEALPKWSVAKKEIFSVKNLASKNVFEKGVSARIKEQVNENAEITAMFVSVNMLSPVQLESLEKLFRVPVYDRYTIILQIFQIRAQTQEAKLQVALAEIPYLRSRLKGVHAGTLDQQKGGLASIGGSGETFLEVRQRLLEEKERKLRKALSSIRQKRDMTKQMRTKKEIPVVAVVGYTNAGKTSLIKALTGNRELEPQDQVFATLDVTAYAGVLPNYMKVLYVDTVGFISNIPTTLVEAFNTTLKDALDANVIIQVHDISHPQYATQKQTVEETVCLISQSTTLDKPILNVYNKIDKASSIPDDLDNPDSICVSATEKLGLAELSDVIQTSVIESTGRIHKRIKIPMNGEHLKWLHKEAVVEATNVCDEDSECLILDVVFTTASYGKFTAMFGSSKNKRRKK